MFSFFRKKAPPPADAPEALTPPAAETTSAAGPGPASAPERSGWLGRLAHGLRKTGSSLSQVFTGTKIDDALYEELESALLMADAGVAATEALLRYQWKDVAHAYFETMSGRLDGSVVNHDLGATGQAV